MQNYKSKFKRFFLRKCMGMLNQIILIVISVVLTFLVTQSYYDRNVNYQVKIDANKELFLKQLQLYNSVQTLCQLDTLYETRTNAVLLDRLSFVQTDDWHNTKIKQVIDQSSMRQKDTIITLPSFVCNNVRYEKFNQQIEFIRANLYLLEPAAYRYCDSLLLFIDNHPLPKSRDDRSEVLSSVWILQNVQQHYTRLLKELSEILESRVRPYLENE